MIRIASWMLVLAVIAAPGPLTAQGHGDGRSRLPSPASACTRTGTVFGDRDTDQPTELAVARWREGLARAGNDDVTLMVFPGAGHGIRMGAEHTHDAPFADGYAEAMLGWLWRHVVAR